MRITKTYHVAFSQKEWTALCSVFPEYQGEFSGNYTDKNLERLEVKLLKAPATPLLGNIYNKIVQARQGEF